MERREQEEERERVGRDGEQRDDAEAEQRPGVTGELLLGPRTAPRREAHPHDEPADERRARRARRAGGSASGAPRLVSSATGSGTPRGNAPTRTRNANSDPHEEPEADAAAQAAERRRQRDAPPPAVREEIDGGDEERQQHRHEHELDRPPAHDPLAQVDVARRPLREVEPLVERAEQLLRRAADHRQARAVQAVAACRRGSPAARSPAVVIVTAGIPRASTGACS